MSKFKTIQQILIEHGEDDKEKYISKDDLYIILDCIEQEIKFVEVGYNDKVWSDQECFLIIAQEVRRIKRELERD